MDNSDMGEIMTDTKQAVTITATQWWKNGDHPNDRVGEDELDVVELGRLHPEVFRDDGTIGPIPLGAPTYRRGEGAIVRYFRRPEPEFAGGLYCDVCGEKWHDHGWINEGPDGHVVCPGDWIVTDVDQSHRPIKVQREVFEALGAASMCWDGMPSGVFMSERASQIGYDLLAALGYPSQKPGEPS